MSALTTQETCFICLLRRAVYKGCREWSSAVSLIDRTARKQSTRVASHAVSVVVRTAVLLERLGMSSLKRLSYHESLAGRGTIPSKLGRLIICCMQAGIQLNKGIFSC